MDCIRTGVSRDDPGVHHKRHAFQEGCAPRTEASQQYQTHAVEALEQSHARRQPPAARSQRDVRHDAQGKAFINCCVVGNYHQSGI